MSTYGPLQKFVQCHRGFIPKLEQALQHFGLKPSSAGAARQRTTTDSH